MFARGGIVPGGAASDDRAPVWLDSAYVIPASMTQPFTFDDSPGDGELRKVALVPVNEDDDRW